MVGFETLEIVVGLVFVYLLFSILVTLVVEYISSILKLRAKNLRKIIERALDDDSNTLSTKFYGHPLIKYLSIKNGKQPSYLGSDKFAKTVLDLIRTKGQIKELGKSSLLDKQSISEAIDSIDIIESDTKSLLKSFAKEAAEDINNFGQRLEAWYNEIVERGQGWFNRKIKLITFIVSFFTAVALNIDSISIYTQLSQNSDLRTQIAESASAYLKESERPKFSDSSYDSARIALQNFYNKDLKPNTNMLKIGWRKSDNQPMFHSCLDVFLALLGWLITGLAISLGAPFWFDLLNKLVALRAAGKSKEDKDLKKLMNQANDKPVG